MILMIHAEYAVLLCCSFVFKQRNTWYTLLYGVNQKVLALACNFGHFDEKVYRYNPHAIGKNLLAVNETVL